MTTPMGSLITLLVSVQYKDGDPVQFFDYFDASKYSKSSLKSKNYIAVFDPKKPSTDCIKAIEMPDGYEPIRFGYHFFEGSSSQKTVGAIVAASKLNS